MSLVYADKPQTLDHLEDNIRRVIADIRPQMLEKVIENWTSRLDYIQASRGSHMPEIIFKIFCAASTKWVGTFPSSIGHSSLALRFRVKEEGDFFIFKVAGAIESDRCSPPNTDYLIGISTHAPQDQGHVVTVSLGPHGPLGH
ncbi:hypothetical protein TNCV_2327931 [Trichonephila clavipes]|nr:hypothetical protein TNCV_2327931 [Trichonephila clavipes]